MFSMFTKPTEVVSPDQALRGRDAPILNPTPHGVSGRSIVPPFPDGFERVLLGLGCFWGAERIFWQVKGVWVTSVGYAGGHTPNATYEEVCSGQTGHSEVVEVVFDPAILKLADVLKIFWESHDPTQGMRQGNDTGTQYRSVIYLDNEDQHEITLASRDAYGAALKQSGRDSITTEIAVGKVYYLAEDYHQQYLHKNPSGYCGIGGCGVAFPKDAARS